MFFKGFKLFDFSCAFVRKAQPKSVEPVPVFENSKTVPVRKHKLFIGHRRKETNQENGDIWYGDAFDQDAILDLSTYQGSGHRIAILASSGAGKSYGAGKVMEELLSAKRILCILDPEGEAYTLAKEKNPETGEELFPVIVIGGDHADPGFNLNFSKEKYDYSYKLDLEQIKTYPKEEQIAQKVTIDEQHKKILNDFYIKIDQYLTTMLDKGISLIWDLSAFSNESDLDFIAWAILDRLFYLEVQKKRPITLIVDEAQTFAPQRGSSKVKSYDACVKIAKRGRKHGINALWMTQRVADFNKSVSTQCNIFLFGRIEADQDFKQIESTLKQAGITFQDLKKLLPGYFYLYSNGITCLIKFGKRLCQHGGETPEFNNNAPIATSKSEILKGGS